MGKPKQKESEGVRDSCAGTASVRFPSTRYQGSKARLVPWILGCLAEVSFDTVLDGFGGTGSVAHMLKREGKRVTYNDILACNSIMAKGLIENRSVLLSRERARELTRRSEARPYQDLVERNFSGVFYTDEENRWIDTVAQNIASLSNPYERSLGFFALCQACLVKRPFNLFHRKNLYLRLNDVPRRFGNKATWDRPFLDHFLKFIDQANLAVFDNGRENRVLNQDVLKVEGRYDLVYMDPPYIRDTGSAVDYGEFYHFLEGLAAYDAWEERIDRTSRHRRLVQEKSRWSTPCEAREAYESFFDRYKESVLAISTRSDGFPSYLELVSSLEARQRNVTVFEYGTYTYALSVNRRSRELLILAE